MKFEVEKTKIDLGSTQIENIFIEDFMPVANGDFVKVYLYALKHMMTKDDFEMDNERLALNLDLNITDVEKAWDYWEEKQVVEKQIRLDGGYDIKFKNLIGYYLENQKKIKEVSPKKGQTDTIIESMHNESIRNMFNNIDYFMRRPTTPTEKMDILSWIPNYNMSPEMVEIAFEYCTEKKNKISVKYVKAVVLSWYDKGLSSVEAIEEEIKKSDEKYVRKNQILRKLGMQYRLVSEPEIKLINSWYDDYKYDEHLIDEAIKRTSQISKPSINYVNSILQKWKQLGILTVEDVSQKDIRPAEKKSVKENKFNNFQGQSKQYSEEELNQIAINIRKRRNLKND